MREILKHKGIDEHPRWLSNLHHQQVFPNPRSQGGADVSQPRDVFFKTPSLSAYQLTKAFGKLQIPPETYIMLSPLYLLELLTLGSFYGVREC